MEGIGGLCTFSVLSRLSGLRHIFILTDRKLKGLRLSPDKCSVSYFCPTMRNAHNDFAMKQYDCTQETAGSTRVGQTFFSKEHNVLAFFYVLYKRTRRSLRSFTLFIKERGVLCVLLRSL